MVQTWSGWKRFPSADGAVDAPAGPGVYEVRHSLTGRVVAFGHAGDLAAALAEFARYGAVGPFARLFNRQVPRVADLEFRICTAASRAEARIIANRLMGMRQTVWRRRLAPSGVRLTG
jgi:hypothetical protein